MAVTSIPNDSRRIEAGMARSLLVTLQMHEAPTQSICYGRAGCGTGVVSSGDRFISPKNPAEEKRLAAIGTDATMRHNSGQWPKDLRQTINEFSVLTQPELIS